MAFKVTDIEKLEDVKNAIDDLLQNYAENSAEYMELLGIWCSIDKLTNGR